MAGAAIKVTVNNRDIQAALARLQPNGALYGAALKNIGIYMVRSIQSRFDTETDPQGRKWAPLNPAYAKNKKGARILSGPQRRLRSSIVWQIIGGTLYVGTNLIYGAIHQFGGTIFPRRGDYLVFTLGGKRVFARKVTIPARAYLGVSEADQTEILGIIQDHVEEVWNGHP